MEEQSSPSNLHANCECDVDEKLLKVEVFHLMFSKRIILSFLVVKERESE